MTGYLTFEEALVLQHMVVDRFGGIQGVTEAGFGRLEAALAVPQQTMFGEDLYPEVLEKAAALFYALVRGHCFSDGNKRTALLALIVFLERNNAQLAAPNDETLFQFVMDAASHLTRDQVTQQLRNYVKENGYDHGDPLSEPA